MENEDRRTDQPHRHDPHRLSRQLVALQVNSGTDVDGLTDGEAQRDAQHTAKEAHGSGLGEEQAS